MNTQRINPEEAIYGRAGDPLRYPGTLPTQPMALLGETAVPLTWPANHHAPHLADGRPLDDLLVARGSAPLRQRIPQIAFGANRDLHNLAWKLRHYQTSEAVSRDVILMPGRVAEADVVACNLGYWGYFYATLLLNHPLTIGCHAPVAVLWLDPAQMRAMHRSEGVPEPDTPPDQRPPVSCDVARQAVTLANGRDITAQLYLLPLPPLSFDGRHPLPFAAVATQGRTLPAATQPQLFDQLAQRIGWPLGDGQTLHRAIRHDGLKDRGGAYAAVRQWILEHFTLPETSGRTKAPQLLSLSEAWYPDLPLD